MFTGEVGMRTLGYWFLVFLYVVGVVCTGWMVYSFIQPNDGFLVKLYACVFYGQCLLAAGMSVWLSWDWLGPPVLPWRK